MEDPPGALDPAMRGRDADDEQVEMVIDRDVRCVRAGQHSPSKPLQSLVKTMIFPIQPPARPTLRETQTRVLRPRGMEPLPGGGVGRQQLEFLHCGHAIARLVEHSICSQREFVAQARTSRDRVSERAACLTRQVGDGV